MPEAQTKTAANSPSASHANDAAAKLGTEKVGVLLLRFSIPAITGMLVNALYNVVDRVFVGRGVGEIALGGLSLVMPLMTFGFAFAMLAGMGAANLLSMRLGQNRKADAGKALNHCFFLLVIIGALLTIMGLIFLDPILKLFGAGEKSEALNFARDYFRIILYGTIPSQLSFGFSHCSRAQGFPMVSMIGMLIGAILNIILDPIFIFVFHWGVEGAAWATIISQFASGIYVLYFAASKKAVVRLKFHGESFDIKVILSIFSFGSSQFLFQLAMSVSQYMLNASILRYGAAALGVENGGDVAISCMNIASTVAMLILMPIFGINQGSQPVLGYNYGAKKWDRVFSALVKSTAAAGIITTAGFVAVQIFAPQIVKMFTPDGSAALMNFAPYATRVMTLILPLVGPQIVASNMFVVTGRPKMTIFLALSRQVIVFIPGLIILGNIWGLYGVLAAQPAADTVTVIITAIVTLREIRSLKRLHNKTIQNETSS